VALHVCAGIVGVRELSACAGEHSTAERGQMREAQPDQFVEFGVPKHCYGVHQRRLVHVQET